jgi:predicted nucleic acid-binding protein
VKLVLDTNVLISALLKSSATRAILLHPSFEFFLPEFGLEEIRRHKPELRKRSRLTEDALDLLLSLLLERVTIVPAAVIAPHLKQAERLIGRRDPGDIPFVAAALAISNDGLWSHDHDFNHITEITVWTTPQLIDHLSKR